MESPVVITRASAIIQIHAAGPPGRDARPSPTLALTIDEVAGRSASVAFWDGAPAPAIGSHREEFHSEAWSLMGTGLVASKSGFPRRPGEEGSFGVAALWPVALEAAEAFSQVGERNALASVEREAGCELFAVVRSLGDASVFALIEIFDNEDSFRLHLETEHFQEFAKFARPRYLGDRRQTVKGMARRV